MNSEEVYKILVVDDDKLVVELIRHYSPMIKAISSLVLIVPVRD